jgi:hypothetical protein
MISRVGIGFIFHELDVTVIQIGHNFNTIQINQGTHHHIIPDRRYTGQTPDTAAAEQVHENGFSVVVFLMTQRDFSVPMALHYLFKKPIARLPRLLLNRTLPGLDLCHLPMERNFQGFGHSFDKSFVSIGIYGSEPMVQMGHCKVQFVPWRQIDQNVEQGC